MKRIAIITAKTGEGHNAAARALAETTTELWPQNTVKIFDIGDYLDSITRAYLINSYSITTRHFPGLWKLIYQASDGKSGDKFFFKILTKIGQSRSKKITTALEKFSPDIIIGTHFFAPYFLNTPSLKKIPVGMVITDFGWHQIWHHPLISSYFVATQAIKNNLVRFKLVPKNSIIVSGIPVISNFYKKNNPNKIKQKHNLPINEPMVLILAREGGQIDPTNFIIGLWSIKKISFVVIAGKNKRLQQKITSLPWPKEIPHAVIGWTNDIAEYILAADIVITKPGGLTISECLAAEKPLLIFSPIPGQEEANSRYLISTGHARLATSPPQLNKHLQFFLKNPNQTKKIKKIPHSGQLIMQKMLEL